MKRKLKTMLAFALSMLMFITMVPVQAITVHDPINAITLLRQLAEAGKQLAEAKRTADQAMFILNSVKGSRNLGDLLVAGVRAGDFAYDVLPPEERAALDGVHNAAGNFARAYQSIDSIKSSLYQLTAPTYNSMTPQQRMSWEQRVYEIARNRGIGSTAYSDAAARFARLNEMRAAINRTDDLKAIGEMQARFQAEQMSLLNYQIQIEALNAQMQAARDQRELEQVGRMLDQGHQPYVGTIEWKK